MGINDLTGRNNIITVLYFTISKFRILKKIVCCAIFGHKCPYFQIETIEYPEKIVPLGAIRVTGNFLKHVQIGNINIYFYPYVNVPRCVSVCSLRSR